METSKEIELKLKFLQKFINKYSKEEIKKEREIIEKTAKQIIKNSGGNPLLNNEI